MLRYGAFYGPGTSISRAEDAVMAAPIRKRRFPIVGDGGGVFFQIHIEDAAAATAIAVEHGRPGIYNVVDDDPAPVREWLPVLARALMPKPPRRTPRWLGRLAAGEAATLTMTRSRVPRTPRPSASSAGARGIGAGGRGSRRDSAKAMTDSHASRLVAGRPYETGGPAAVCVTPGQVGASRALSPLRGSAARLKLSVSSVRYWLRWCVDGRAR